MGKSENNHKYPADDHPAKSDKWLHRREGHLWETTIITKGESSTSCI